MKRIILFILFFILCFTVVNGQSKDRHTAKDYYNIGVAYYNQAIYINTQMNNIAGVDDSDLNKWQVLKQSRNEMYLNSKPYFEKVKSILASPENIPLYPDEMEIFNSSSAALIQINGSIKR